MARSLARTRICARASVRASALAPARGSGVAERDAPAARWLDPTRRLLPGMVARHAWPIPLDHCFMRVCLDAALGRSWHETVRRPAVPHPTDDRFRRAVAVAVGVAEDPARPSPPNGESLRLRGHAHR